MFQKLKKYYQTNINIKHYNVYINENEDSNNDVCQWRDYLHLYNSDSPTIWCVRVKAIVEVAAQGHFQQEGAG